jgi:hypothetical protein
MPQAATMQLRTSRSRQNRARPTKSHKSANKYGSVAESDATTARLMFHSHGSMANRLGKSFLREGNELRGWWRLVAEREPGIASRRIPGSGRVMS